MVTVKQLIVLNAKVQQLPALYYHQSIDDLNPFIKSEKYNIFYHQKRHTIHGAVFKISKTIDITNINTKNVDIYIERRDRYSIKFVRGKVDAPLTTVEIAIRETKHTELPEKYIVFYEASGKRTGKGAKIEHKPLIKECATVVTRIEEPCFKHISRQESQTGNHFLDLYVIVKPSMDKIPAFTRTWISNTRQLVEEREVIL